jgi:hypothetical protein
MTGRSRYSRSMRRSRQLSFSLDAPPRLGRTPTRCRSQAGSDSTDRASLAPDVHGHPSGARHVEGPLGRAVAAVREPRARGGAVARAGLRARRLPRGPLLPPVQPRARRGRGRRSPRPRTRHEVLRLATRARRESGLSAAGLRARGALPSPAAADSPRGTKRPTLRADECAAARATCHQSGARSGLVRALVRRVAGDSCGRGPRAARSLPRRPLAHMAAPHRLAPTRPPRPGRRPGTSRAFSRYDSLVNTPPSRRRGGASVWFGGPNGKPTVLTGPRPGSSAAPPAPVEPAAAGARTEHVQYSENDQAPHERNPNQPEKVILGPSHRRHDDGQDHQGHSPASEPEPWQSAKAANPCEAGTLGSRYPERYVLQGRVPTHPSP